MESYRTGRGSRMSAKKKMNRDYLAKTDESIPNIAGTSAMIERFRNVPLGLRLDYLAARSKALSLTGLVGYEAAANHARSLLERVYAAEGGSL